jgi:hypothetical protein
MSLNCLVVELFFLLQRLAPFHLQLIVVVFTTAAINELSQNASASLPKGTSFLGLKKSTLLEIYFRLIKFKLQFQPKKWNS